MKRKRFRHFIEKVLLYLALYIFPRSNRGVCLRRGARIGELLGLIGVRRNVVLKNLDIAFGDTKSQQEKHDIARRMYRFLGSLLGEFFYIRYIPREELLSLVTVDNPEMLERLRRDNAAGPVTIMSAHVGFWEMGNLYFPALFERYCAYSGKQKNPHTEKLITEFRNRFGGEMIARSAQSTLTIMKRLRKNYLYAVLGDISMYKDALFLPFFGLKAAFGKGVGYFPARVGCPVYFAVFIREADTRYRLYINPMTYETDAAEEETAVNITRAYIQEVERIVSLYPEQYYWVTRHWKHRPPEESDVKIY